MNPLLQWGRGTVYILHHTPSRIINSCRGMPLTVSHMHILHPSFLHTAILALIQHVFRSYLSGKLAPDPLYPASCVEPISSKTHLREPGAPRGNGNASADTVIPCDSWLCYWGYYAPSWHHSLFIHLSSVMKKRDGAENGYSRCCMWNSHMSRWPLTGSHVDNGWYRITTQKCDHRIFQ